MRLYRLPEAIELLNRWIEIDPEDTEPFVRRAWVEERQLDFDNALTDYRRVIAMDPQRWPVRAQIAEILFKIRKPDEAVAELKLLREHQPQDASVAVNLSRCYREMGEYDNALEALDQLPDDARSSSRVQAELGHVALFKEDYVKAESLFRSALKAMPREREVLYGLHQALSRLGKSSDADEVQAILKQVDADGRRMGQIITGLTRNPADAALRYEGASIFLRNGVKEDGVRWLQMTLEADPRHIGAHERLAEYFEEQGRPDLAAVHRDVVRKLENSSP
jgi:tetratricopeptide (TPR) repeat protein